VTWTSGLPPVAHQRLERQRAGQLAGSLLSAGAAAAVRSIGYSAVGEVMGCTVMHLGWAGYACGYGSFGGGYGSFGGGYGTAPVIVSGEIGPHGEHQQFGLGPRAAAYNRGWDTTLHRLLLEARALGADGVIGVRLSERALDVADHEFVALGTAVRAPGRAPSGRDGWPFCTELSGEDVAKLVGAGWLPTGIVIGLSMGLRHDDYGTQLARSSWSNQEIVGYSQLLAATRADARRQLSARGARAGGEQVVISSMATSMFEREVAEGHTDHGAHTTIIGTAIRHVAPGEAPPGTPGPGAGPGTPLRGGLTVMPLSGGSPSGRRTTGRRSPG
jgi:uncharacterized protein YbjQ (UPF0145 family)